MPRARCRFRQNRRRSERYRLSYWDGEIVAAAELMGAKTLYTEDLNDGQRYGGVCVCNPFRTTSG